MNATECTDPGGRDALRLQAGLDEVLIARCGAQVLSWRHRGQDVLWQASRAEYAPGRAVRGGAPVVFPWFGHHRTEPSLPQHGFVRTLDWQLDGTGPGARAVFALEDDERTRALWPHRFWLELAVTLGDGLQIALTIMNRGDQPFACEAALHTYLAVGDVRTAAVHGLEGVPFVEHAAEPEAAWDPQAPLRFRAETDRVFQQMPARVALHTPALGRTITLHAPAARSAIVWTPWPNKAARLSQLGPDDWQRFVCIEHGLVHGGALRLVPGQTHVMALALAVGPG
jgi:glucose-6-phosphate 1-epimerase